MPSRAKATLIALGILEGPAPEPPPEPSSGHRVLAIFLLTTLILVALFALAWLVLRAAGLDFDFDLVLICVGGAAGVSWMDWRRGR